MAKTTKLKLLLLSSLALTPVLANSCILKLDENLLAARKFANDNYFINLPKFEEVNKDATPQQIILSQDILKSKFLLVKEEFAKVQFKKWGANDKNVETMSFEDVFEVYNHYLKQTPYSINLYENYDKLFTKNSQGITSVGDFDIALPSNDVIFNYYFYKVRKLLDKVEDFDIAYKKLMKQLVAWRITINNKQKQGMMWALSPIQLTRNLKDATSNSPTDGTSLFKEVITDENLLEEFANDPEKFIVDHKDLLVDIEAIKNSDVQKSLRRLISVNIKNFGASQREVLRLVANLLFINGFSKMQVSYAIDTTKKELYYFLEAFNKTANSWVIYDVQQHIELLKTDPNAELKFLTALPSNWKRIVVSLDSSSDNYFATVLPTYYFGDTPTQKKENAKKLAESSKRVYENSMIK
ncbi:Uncharacterised protein [Mycoplasmopsis californica]|uniref:Lipoprotein n=1 Tax=Mycoplasmopsis equigenitalium TaxID=114883 RepID=A0ABY5J0S8_9BACT|nr:hypothetical protein [Mycoplasmopsis equigenitalium]UUD36860.1 hypothetical protein NPA09_03100 [Mycoplasmopsis equigenitalium]VEU69845.1 Uncharacterised protein [Mycoplasmopsis californica]